MPQPKVVVTGASGFLGRHLCEVLARSGHEVVAITRQASRPHPLWTTLQVNSYEEMPSFPQAICVHLAGENRVAEVARNFEKLREEALKLLKTLSQKNFARVVLASSSAVYGDREGTHLYEESETPRPTGPYGQLKLALEEKLFALMPQSLVLRFSNLYGPGMSRESLLGELMLQLGQGAASVKIRSLNSVRDYLWVQDACQALRSLISVQAQGIFNVSSGQGVSIAQLLEELRRVVGRNFGVDTSDSTKSTQVFQLALNPKKLQSAAGWKAQTSLNEGLSLCFKEIS